MSSNATPVYRIHPGIGIARLGDSAEGFCISPETPGALPIACDAEGVPRLNPDGTRELPVEKFKDAEGRILRQAARFRLYVLDDESPEGRPLRLGDEVFGGGNHGTLIDIQWRVYLANKKAAWYEFDQLQGEHGYPPGHPRRNREVTDPEARQRLIIDPGPRIVNATSERRASFSRDASGLYAPTFPPPLVPHSIETLGDLLTDREGRLLVLGGHGRSGSALRGPSDPRIETYANNDGWFDDTSDGPVMARLVIYSKEVSAIRYVDVEYPAWVVVGYPAYVPEILDMVSVEDVVYDMAIREFAWRTDLFGEAGSFTDPPAIDPGDPESLRHWRNGRLEWNEDYRPWFYRDIWPILFRVDEMRYLTNVLAQSNYPHDQTARGNFDPEKLGAPPVVNEKALAPKKRESAESNQSGALFLESVEPALLLLDDGASKAPSRLAHRLEAPFDGERSGREALAAAAADYARAVSPGGTGDDPERYLWEWRSAAKSEVHREDARRFRERVEEIVDLLSGPEALARRERDDGSRKPLSGLSIEEAIEREVEGFLDGRLLSKRFAEDRERSTTDYFRMSRLFLFELLRQPGEENTFRLTGRPDNRMFQLPLMPLLAGDNPISNTHPSKFLRLTDYQLYLLRQWARGKFVNERREGWVDDIHPFRPYEGWTNRTALDLDRSVLMNLLGGAFCPGGELCWIVRNPAVYREPFRIKADPDFCNFHQTAAQANSQAKPTAVTPLDYVSDSSALPSQSSSFERGLQPGDLTKYGALPWQADFNECTTQTIDITYEQWNVIDPASENDPWMRVERQVWDTLWWPAHRPLQTYEITGLENGAPQLQYRNWARGVPPTNAGDLKMVTEWSRLGFVVRNPYLSEEELDLPSPDDKYVSVERNDVEPGTERGGDS